MHNRLAPSDEKVFLLFFQTRESFRGSWDWLLLPDRQRLWDPQTAIWSEVPHLILSTLGNTSQAMARRYGWRSTFLLMVGLVQSLIPSYVNIDSGKLINKNQNVFVRFAGRGQFNTKIGSSICQRFMESLSHVDGVFPTVCYFFPTFFRLIISSQCHTPNCLLYLLIL